MDFITIIRGLKNCLENTPESVNYHTIKYFVYKKEFLKKDMEVSFYHKQNKRKYTGLLDKLEDNIAFVKIKENLNQLKSL